MKTIAIYARVSSERQKQQETVDSQLSALNLRVQADGHTILPNDIYIDDGYSGSTLIRPALERLRDRIAEGGIDIVYAHSPDRLARRYAYQVLLLEEFLKGGAATVFVNSPKGETAEDELLIQVQGIIAEYERANILERCRRGKLHRARQGQVSVMSGAPYGYRYIKRTEAEPARYEVALDDANTVRQMFHWLVYDQISLTQIAKRLNEQSVPTPSGGNHWRSSSVGHMLRNPTYKGTAIFGRTEMVESRPLRRRKGRSAVPRRAKSAQRSKPHEEWIYIEVPALISEDTFCAAQKQLERNQRLAQRNARGQRYLLQGLTLCAKCGYAFCGRSTKATRAKRTYAYSYYYCIGTSDRYWAGGRVCDNKMVRADQLDQYVWDSVCTVLQEPERVFEQWSRRGQSDGTLAELREHRTEANNSLKRRQRGLQRLIDAYEAGALELEEFTERSQLAREHIKRAERNLQEAEQDLSSVVELSAVEGRLEAFCERLRCRLDELSWDERRQIIRMIVSQVEIDEEGATVVYRIPGGSGGNSSRGDDSEESYGSTNNDVCLLHPRRSRDDAVMNNAG